MGNVRVFLEIQVLVLQKNTRPKIDKDIYAFPYTHIPFFQLPRCSPTSVRSVLRTSCSKPSGTGMYPSMHCAREHTGHILFSLITFVNNSHQNMTNMLCKKAEDTIPSIITLKSIRATQTCSLVLSTLFHQYCTLKCNGHDEIIIQ